LKTYARMDGDVVAEIIQVPEGHTLEAMFPPDLVAAMLPVDGLAVSAGMVRQPDGSFTAPALAAVPPERINASIQVQLAAIDARSVRPLRAILEAQTAGIPPDSADLARLADLDAQAVALRAALVT
jgi:hypothetical protein